LRSSHVAVLTVRDDRSDDEHQHDAALAL